jgi:protein subunit release factor B
MTPDALVAYALTLVEESFIASAGPGGQNVNKVATAVQIRLDVYALRLPPPVFHRLKELAGSQIDRQRRNRDDRAQLSHAGSKTAKTRANAWANCCAMP